MSRHDTITEGVRRVRAGEERALDRLVPLIYGDSRLLAHRQLRTRRPGQSLSTTGLVHATYLKLVGQRRASWRDRGQALRDRLAATRGLHNKPGS